jgi:hypothetical protein
MDLIRHVSFVDCPGCVRVSGLAGWLAGTVGLGLLPPLLWW